MTPLALLAAALIALAIIWVGDIVALALAADETDRALARRLYGDADGLTGHGQRAPVSIVIAVRDDGPTVVSSVRAAVQQRYSDFEVIVVDDGSVSGTLDALIAAFGLRRHDPPVRRVSATRAINAMYESAATPHLRVVTRRPGRRADAFNCGVSLAHHRYTCIAQSNMVLVPDALADAMRFVLTDSRPVVGIVMPLLADVSKSGRDTRRVFDRWLSHMERLQQLSDFVLGAVAESRLNAVFCHGDQLTIWRRDVLERLGGFSRRVVDPIAEFSFRVQRQLRDGTASYHVVAIPLVQGRRIIHPGWRMFVRARTTRHQSLFEQLWRYRGMLLRKRFGGAGLLAMPRLLTRLAVRPVVIVGGAVAAAVALARGTIGPLDVLVGIAGLAFARGLVTTAALLIHDRAGRTLPIGELLRLALLAPLQPLMLGPAFARAGASAAWRTIVVEPRRRAATTSPAGDSTPQT